MATKRRSRSLVAALQRIVGADAVLHAPDDMVVFEYDASIGKHAPQAVVAPATTAQVAAIVRLANAAGVPIVPRGAGTGLSGGAVAPRGGVVIAMTRMTRILEMDAVNRMAVVEPGVVNYKLSQVAHRYGLHYAPDPSSQKVCTIGGNIAENSGGPHCLAYGVTTNHALGMEVVLPSGEAMWMGGKEQDRPGYDLTGLFVGSEGTIGIATKIVVRLTPNPEAVRTMVAAFPEMEQASGAVSAIIARGIVPAALEMIDAMTITAVRPLMPDATYMDGAAAVLLIEVDGLRESTVEEAALVEAVCREQGATQFVTATRAEERERLWWARKNAFGALGRLAPNYYILDGVVPRTKLTPVLRQVNEIGKRYGFPIANVFHAGDGNLHPCVAFDERIAGQSERVLEAGAEIMQACIDAGGSITGEHGVGLEKKKFMPLIFSADDLAAQEKLKAAFGATELFNPCKVLPSGAGCGDGLKFPQRLPDLGPGTAW
ncbi:MAG: FAD-binding protein [Dehalococcoidia bacterium]|nr:FAD-binding protein [Dehalococcoidia bacterium]